MTSIVVVDSVAFTLVTLLWRKVTHQSTPHMCRDEPTLSENAQLDHSKPYRTAQ